MKQRTFIFVLGMALCLAAISYLSAQDQKDKKAKKSKMIIENRHAEIEAIEIPEIELDMSGLEASLEHLELSLSHLEHFHIPDIDFDIPPIPPIHVDIPPIPDINFDIPQIEFDMPEIVIPDLDFDGFEFEYHGESTSMYRDLSDNEQLKISALRSMKRKSADEVLPVVEKILKEEKSEALRYESVNLLKYHLDSEKAIKLLGQVAKSDNNVEVRKRAVRILGRSKDTNAVKILEEIANR